MYGATITFGEAARHVVDARFKVRVTLPPIDPEDEPECGVESSVVLRVAAGVASTDGRRKVNVRSSFLHNSAEVARELAGHLCDEASVIMAPDEFVAVRLAGLCHRGDWATPDLVVHLELEEVHGCGDGKETRLIVVADCVAKGSEVELLRMHHASRTGPICCAAPYVPRLPPPAQRKGQEKGRKRTRVELLAPADTSGDSDESAFEQDRAQLRSKLDTRAV